MLFIALCRWLAGFAVLCIGLLHSNMRRKKRNALFRCHHIIGVGNLTEKVCTASRFGIFFFPMHLISSGRCPNRQLLYSD